MSTFRLTPEADALPADLLDVARQFEFERYIAATLAPSPTRLALIALAAYAADLQRIAANATQPMLGEIRLQWWRDSLQLIEKGNRIGSPLADALAAAIKTYELPVAMLVAMSEARAFDLYDDPMPDEASFDGYLSKTEAIPFELALRVLGMPAGEAGAISTPAGRIFGMTRILARLPALAASGHVPLPVTLLSVHGVSAEMLASGAYPEAVRSLVAFLIGEIRQAMAELRPRFAALSRHQRVALLPLAVVSPYLTSIQRSKRDPARDTAELAPLARVWRIAIARVLGRI